MSLKTKFFKVSKKHFPKELTHAFGQNMQFFSLFVFVKKEHEIRFNNVLNIKETFFDKNGILPKGLTHAFSQKMQFLNFFFSLKIRLELRVNNVLDRKKKLFWDYKDKIFHSLKNSHFSKGVNPCFC